MNFVTDRVYVWLQNVLTLIVLISGFLYYFSNFPLVLSLSVIPFTHILRMCPSEEEVCRKCSNRTIFLQLEAAGYTLMYIYKLKSLY